MSKDYNKIETKPLEVVNGEEVIEKKKFEPVVTKQPKKKKKGLVERLVIGFIGPDGTRGIGEYLGQEIVVPAIKNIIVDSFTSGINMMMFGSDSRPSGKNASQWSNRGGYGQPTGGYSPKTNYGAQSQPKAVRAATSNRVDDYLLEDRHEALAVLNSLQNSIADYGYVSLADYYDLIGVEARYTDNNYGWHDLTYARINPTRGGYVISLPALEVE